MTKTMRTALAPLTIPARGDHAGIYRELVFFDIIHPDYTAEANAPARIKPGSVRAAETPGTQLRHWGDHCWAFREQGDMAVVEVEWDGAHAVKLTRIVQFQGRVDIDLTTGVARVLDLDAFRKEVGPAVLKRLREGWFGEYPTDQFRTSDGYVLTRCEQGWTDGDMTFMALPSGWPAEILGEPLDGEYLDTPSVDGE